MNRFDAQPTSLDGVMVITRQRIGDHRGSLSRVFCARELATAGWLKPIVQINHTHTQRRGTVRGMHFQRVPHAEMKLVSCIRGAVLDVAVDVRRQSPTYLRWHAEELSAENGRSLLIPEGFAHGFQALSDDCEMLYFHTAEYTPQAEAGVHALDSLVGIEWPLPVVELSARDASHPPASQLAGDES